MATTGPNPTLTPLFDRKTYRKEEMLAIRAAMAPSPIPPEVLNFMQSQMQDSSSCRERKRRKG